MYVLLFDIMPQAYQVKVTVRLAVCLYRQGSGVYYTHSSDSVFTADLLDKGIGRVVYPDDLSWFVPDLGVLDALLKERHKVYARLGIRCVYVTVRRGTDGPKVGEADGIPQLYLPPSPCEALTTSARKVDFVDRIGEIKEDRSRSVIIGMMEKDGDLPAGLEQTYRTLRMCGMENPEYQFIVLTDRGETEERLFALPPNVSVYRPQDLQALLPLCDLALTPTEGSAWAECVFSHTPALELSPHDWRSMTPRRLDRRIKEALRNRDYLTDRQRQLCRYYERENEEVEEMAAWLLKYIESKKNR